MLVLMGALLAHPSAAGVDGAVPPLPLLAAASTSTSTIPIWTDKDADPTAVYEPVRVDRLLVNGTEVTDASSGGDREGTLTSIEFRVRNPGRWLHLNGTYHALEPGDVVRLLSFDGWYAYESTGGSGGRVTLDGAVRYGSFHDASTGTTIEVEAPAEDDGGTSGGDGTSSDADGDGLTNAEESELCSDPSLADTDGDELADGDEVRTYGTHPCHPDTDADTLSDGDEVHVHNTDPTSRDTDGDGLDDRREVLGCTDPLATDSDGDGVSDGDEVYDRRTDPCRYGGWLLVDIRMRDRYDALEEVDGTAVARWDDGSPAPGVAVTVTATHPLPPSYPFSRFGEVQKPTVFRLVGGCTTDGDGVCNFTLAMRGSLVPSWVGPPTHVGAGGVDIGLGSWEAQARATDTVAIGRDLAYFEVVADGAAATRAAT